MSDELENVVRQEVEANGFEFVELRRGGTRARPLIEVRIDRRDGSKITVDDCASVSRAIEARLDGSTIVSESYVLQVSSPGDRPLRSLGDWQRFIGKWANVLSPAQGGRFEGKIAAIEGGQGAEVVVLELERGPQRRIPLADVKEARLAFHL
ncbi:MAG: ribosome maturation factor RimP [Gemmatimonadaceae bacterium]